MNNNTWTIEQTKALFNRCAAARKAGKSLSAAFEETAKLTDRSVNSVRNYYYSQAKTFELVPDIAEKLGISKAEVHRDGFVPFRADEIDSLISSVLTAKAKGVSVRAAIAELAEGDGKTALRLQNKYRSVLRSHRDDVERIMAELERKGVEYYNPYKKYEADNFSRLTEYPAPPDEKKVGKFLSIIDKLT